jgi:hypothetical protein
MRGRKISEILWQESKRGFLRGFFNRAAGKPFLSSSQRET